MLSLSFAINVVFFIFLVYSFIGFCLLILISVSFIIYCICCCFSKFSMTFSYFLVNFTFFLSSFMWVLFFLQLFFSVISLFLAFDYSFPIVYASDKFSPEDDSLGRALADASFLDNLDLDNSGVVRSQSEEDFIQSANYLLNLPDSPSKGNSSPSQPVLLFTGSAIDSGSNFSNTVDVVPSGVAGVSTPSFHSPVSSGLIPSGASIVSSLNVNTPGFHGPVNSGLIPSGAGPSSCSTITSLGSLSHPSLDISSYNVSIDCFLGNGNNFYVLSPSDALRVNCLVPHIPPSASSGLHSDTDLISFNFHSIWSYSIDGFWNSMSTNTFKLYDWIYLSEVPHYASFSGVSKISRSLPFMHSNLDVLLFRGVPTLFAWLECKSSGWVIMISVINN